MHTYIYIYIYNRRKTAGAMGPAASDVEEALKKLQAGAPGKGCGIVQSQLWLYDSILW